MALLQLCRSVLRQTVRKLSTRGTGLLTRSARYAMDRYFKGTSVLSAELRRIIGVQFAKLSSIALSDISNRRTPAAWQ